MGGTLIFVTVAWVIGLGFFAHYKGYNPLFWIFSLGMVGLLVLLLMPSARPHMDDSDEILGAKRDRARLGNYVGGALSAVCLGFSVFATYSIWAEFM